MTTFEIDKYSNIGKYIFGDSGICCPLFYICCGNSPSRPIVDSIDDKHVMKRCRMTLKRPEGVRVKEVVFTKSLLSMYLIEASIASHVQVVNMWGEGDSTDAQNVPAAMKLMLSIASFREKTAQDFPRSKLTPTFAGVFKELLVLAEYCAKWFEIVSQQSSLSTRAGVYLSLSELVASAVALSHMAFVLYRHNGSAFVPAQHYYNTQKLVHGKYVSMATAKSIGQELYFWYQDADDRLEGFFGEDRGLRGGSNVDQVQFDERAGDLQPMPPPPRPPSPA